MDCAGSKFVLSLSGGGTLWYDHYNYEETLILDEFGSGGMRLDSLLALINRHPVVVEMKGSCVKIRPKRIIITTNVPPALWYEDVKNREQRMAGLYRRMLGEVWLFSSPEEEPKKVEPTWRAPPPFFRAPKKKDEEEFDGGWGQSTS